MFFLLKPALRLGKLSELINDESLETEEGTGKGVQNLPKFQLQKVQSRGFKKCVY